MKYLICILMILVVGCNWINKKVEDKTKQCIVLCGAIQDLQCFTHDADKAVDFGTSVIQCMDRCTSENELITKINVDCLLKLNKCEVGKCISLE